MRIIQLIKTMIIRETENYPTNKTMIIRKWELSN